MFWQSNKYPQVIVGIEHSWRIGTQSSFEEIWTV